MRRVVGSSAESLLPSLQEAVEPGAVVITDGLQSYRVLPQLGYSHDRRVQAGSSSAGDGERPPAGAGNVAMGARPRTEAKATDSPPDPTVNAPVLDSTIPFAVCTRTRSHSNDQRTLGRWLKVAYCELGKSTFLQHFFELSVRVQLPQ